MRIICMTIMLGFFVSTSLLAAGLNELTEKNYVEEGSQKAVVILQVNWGRHWKCAGLDNAQLQALQFSKMQTSEAKSTEQAILLETPSKLFSKDSYVPYVLLIEPGEYALTGFDVKVARSSSDVGHIKGDLTTLLKNKKPVGGSFSAGPGEIVYIGHFGLDCAKEAIPWRYYIEGNEDFERYVAGFHKKYPFTKDIPVLFRLFSTTMFGEAYSLNKE